MIFCPCLKWICVGVPHISFDTNKLFTENSGGEAGSWHAYQINIVLSYQSRYNLLESAGREQLDKIGEALSRYIGVPFKKYDKDIGK